MSPASNTPNIGAGAMPKIKTFDEEMREAVARANELLCETEASMLSHAIGIYGESLQRNGWNADRIVAFVHKTATEKFGKVSREGADREQCRELLAEVGIEPATNVPVVPKATMKSDLTLATPTSSVPVIGSELPASIAASSESAKQTAATSTLPNVVANLQPKVGIIPPCESEEKITAAPTLLKPTPVVKVALSTPSTVNKETPAKKQAPKRLSRKRKFYETTSDSESPEEEMNFEEEDVDEVIGFVRPIRRMPVRRVREKN